MKLTEMQLDIAQAAFRDVWLRRATTTRDSLIAAFSAIEPEPVEVPQDLVDRMIWEWFGDRTDRPNPLPYHRRRMAAALRVALEDERVLGNITQDEWETAKLTVVDCGSRIEVAHRDIIDREIMRSRRARLFKPKIAEERIRIDNHETCWAVMLDGKIDCMLNGEREAEIYRLGLIAKLRAEQEAKS